MIKKSVKNTITGIFVMVATLLIKYIVRMSLVKGLSEDYVGIHGLFENWFACFTLQYFRFDVPLAFSLYHLIQLNDKERQRKELLKFNRYYNRIGFMLLFSGLVLYPLVKLLLRNSITDFKDLFWVYLLHLLISVVTYFNATSGIVLMAYQDNYINNYVILAVQLLVRIPQIFLAKYYKLYLVLSLLGLIVRNIIITIYERHWYKPVLYSESTVDKLRIGSKLKSGSSNILALLLHRAMAILVSNIDNMLFTMFFSVALIGKVSNYCLILSGMQSVFNQVVNGIKASIGTLGAVDDVRKSKDAYRILLFSANSIHTMCVLYSIILADSLVKWGFGSNYQLEGGIVYIAYFNYYLNGIRGVNLMYRDSMGLYTKDRLKVVIEAVVNLVLSVILLHIIGESGILLGTTLSLLFVSLWYESYIIYKYTFKESYLSHIKDITRYLLCTALSLIIALVSIKGIGTESFHDVMTRMVVATIVYIGVFVGLTYKQFEFQQLYKLLRHRG